jgi:hypothetical protein
MAQFQSPLTFTSGQVLTAADLNAHVNSATLLPGSINDQTAITAFDIQSTDTFNIYDSSGAVLRKATVDDLFRSGMIAKFDNISGKSGQNLAITPASGFAVAINGNLTSSGTLAVTSTSTLSGDVTAGANLTVVGLANFNTTEAIKLPVGTTAQRPGTPATGQIRYNSTLAATEIYNGTAWDPVPVAGTNLTLPNTVNFTGTIQYNGTAVYGLTAIYEENIGSVTGSGVIWTSSPFTKPSDEIWVFEVNSVIATIGGSAWSGNLSFLNTSGTSYFTIYDANVGGFDYSGTALAGGDFDCRWVVQAGVTLTAETVRISLNLTSGAGVTLNPTFLANPNSKFRIYKYRTA